MNAQQQKNDKYYTEYELSKTLKKCQETYAQEYINTIKPTINDFAYNFDFKWKTKRRIEFLKLEIKKLNKIIDYVNNEFKKVKKNIDDFLLDFWIENNNTIKEEKLLVRYENEYFELSRRSEDKITEELIERCRKVNVSDVYQTEWINLGPLKKAKCPFHNDKTPSFYAYPGKRGFYCFSDDTEILTEKGFLKIKKIVNNKIKIKVASLNLSNLKVEYKPIVKYFKRYYNGEMYNFYSKQFDALVSPEHKMLVQTEWNYKYGKKTIVKERKAKNISKSNKFLKIFNFDGKHKEYFYLPSLRRRVNQFKIYKTKPKIKIKMNDWLDFFGIWLADGHATNNGYIIGISAGLKDYKYQKKIKETIKKIGFKFSKNKCTSCYQFIICNIQLGNYLEQFGKAGEKFIPNEFKKLSIKQLQILFDSMYLGDGNKSIKVFRYNTISEKLANDFQEISIKLGLNANVSVKKNLSYIYKNKRKKTKDYYRVNLSKIKKGYSIKIKKQKYNGYLYNLTVEPHHNIFIKRNGKCCWTKQCYGCGKGGSVIDFVMEYNNYDFIQAIKFLKPYA